MRKHLLAFFLLVLASSFLMDWTVADENRIKTLKLVGLSELPKGEIRIRFVVARPPSLSTGAPVGPIDEEKKKSEFKSWGDSDELSFELEDFPQISAEPKHTWNYLLVDLKKENSEEVITWYLILYDYKKMIWSKPFETEEEVDTDTVVLPILLTPSERPFPIDRAWDERFGIDQ